VPVGAAFSGQASWYGGSFQGRRTANGEVFDTNALTAASRTLPFGTRLRVCRLGRCVVVRVNDRGPYVGGRVLDLTRAAVNALGYDGVALVTATPVDSRTVAVRLPAPRPRRSTRPAPRRTTTPAPAPSASPSASPAPADRPVLAAATSPAGQDAPAAVLAGALVVLGAGPVLRARCRRTGS
ncbi:MAG: septal ring lytic transglycosylase RlpA family protein, partial [Mycobacteriales bacterium]